MQSIWLARLRTAFACIAFTLGCFSPNAHAERGAVGFSLIQEVFIDDSALAGSIGQLQVNVFFGYYASPFVEFLASFDAEVEPSPRDPEDRSLGFGFRYFFLPFNPLTPFFSLEAVGNVDPDPSIGYRVGVGGRYDLFYLVGSRGLMIFAQLAQKGIFEKTGGPFFSFEFLRVGFELNF